MTPLTITALAALALAVPAASAAPARQEASPSIAAIAASSPQFSTLLSLVKKAGLAGTLSKPGAYTVFAPTNAAFAKVPKATLNALAKNPAAVEARPALPRRRRQGHRCEVVKLRSAKTLAGPTVRIRVTGKTVRINSAQVTKADVEGLERRSCT